MPRKVFCICQGGTYISTLKDFDGDLVSFSGLNETLQIAATGLVWHPARLFGIIGLLLELGLQLISDS